MRLTREAARRRLVSHHGLCRPQASHGGEAVRELLAARRCIQLDPLDRIGTNADLVAHARVDGLGHGEVYAHLLPGHAFEHFAKERCLLPAAAFAAWRGQAVETPWWRSSERQRRLPRAVLEAVEAEVLARGPVRADELTDHGAVEPLDWNGWKGTGRATTLALEVLWRQCRVVVHSRTPRGKRYSAPEVSLGAHARAPAPSEGFARWALLERVEASGLLARGDGPWWSTLSEVRRSALPDALVAEGALVEVELEGARRRYLTSPRFLEAPVDPPDDRMRVLGPLDPLIWDRRLVQHAFGFEYVWEVYKPASRRRWGWYVCPLLLRGRLVGRVEAHVEQGRVVVDRCWRERGFLEPPFEEAMHRLQGAVDRRVSQGEADPREG